jgi:predicted amidophosphoribosyltransferase
MRHDLPNPTSSLVRTLEKYCSDCGQALEEIEEDSGLCEDCWLEEGWAESENETAID